MTDPISFFTRAGADLVPTPLACSMWSDDQMHGVAVSGALARAAEEGLAGAGRTDLRPARWSVDLFRQARMQPCAFTTEVVREGSRICLVDVTMSQGGERVARASATFLKPSASTDGEVWEPAGRPSPPPLDVAPPSDEPRVPFLLSGGTWSQDFTQHQNADRKAYWTSAIPVVPDEPLTGFQTAAAAADSASMVTNWGTRGVEYINTDIALTLARQPAGLEIGLLATDRVEHDGIASGTCAMFDRSGPLGTVTVAALANSRRAVDLSGVEYSDNGERRKAPGV
ncbi:MULTISPECIES: acyl-CoA thioesterase domain-containing protein [unclassified Nocardioides]|uniref:acyl-CoA thioesterase domain-containing protein n=1 Tax=Nocardioides sp. URHA0032 TaxID=1380388 RepID=UPI0006891332|nr:acyl-CoA thioesterase domain-containing protein [Nocardioides sp. URHA0032]